MSQAAETLSSTKGAGKTIMIRQQTEEVPDIKKIVSMLECASLEDTAEALI